MSSLVCVAVFHDRMRAEMMRELLEGEGIPARLRIDDGGGLRPELAYTVGIRLEVGDENRQRALDMLRDYGAGDFGTLREDDPGGRDRE